MSALALSPSGRLLASGQVTYLGFAADIIIWDLPSRTLLHRLQLQKVRGRALRVAAAGASPCASRRRLQLRRMHPHAPAFTRVHTHATRMHPHAPLTRQIQHTPSQVKIQDLAFSPDETMLASLGGADDNSLVRRLHAAARARPAWAPLAWAIS